jgi:F-type H+-transporting ATPase subunit gamma
MPSLKDYRDRIASVKSTRKITSAMKMVAASKLKKAQEQAEASQPYAQAMAEMMARVASNVSKVGGPKLLVGTGEDNVHLLVVITADRGLCGGFNGNLSRKVKLDVGKLESQGKTVKLLTVGRKGYGVLKREYATKIVQRYSGIGAGGKIAFSEADEIAQFILEQFNQEEFDVCTLYYNNFKSVLAQIPSAQQLIPFHMEEDEEIEGLSSEKEEDQNEDQKLHYDFEPDEQEIMSQLLPKNLGVQLFRSLLDSAAGEQAARMTAMDNATRNAGDMINNITLKYNRARQAAITKELIEIISGAEAL